MFDMPHLLQNASPCLFSAPQEPHRTTSTSGVATRGMALLRCEEQTRQSEDPLWFRAPQFGQLFVSGILGPGISRVSTRTQPRLRPTHWTKVLKVGNPCSHKAYRKICHFLSGLPDCVRLETYPREFVCHLQNNPSRRSLRFAGNGHKACRPNWSGDKE